MTLREIKEQVVALVSATQLDIGGLGDAFVAVYDYPRDDFDGYPNAVVLLESSESETLTNIENERTDTFVIYIQVLIEDDGLTAAEAMNRVYDLMDSCRNALDRSENFGDQALRIDPSTGGAQILETSAGMAAIGEVRAEVRHTYDFKV